MRYKMELKKLLEKQWNNEGMVEHCLKSNKYIRIADKWLNIGDKKPSIRKQFWFDDEKPIPEPTKELFIRQNLFLNGPEPYELTNRYHEPLVIIPNYWDDRTDFELCSLAYGNDSKGEQIEVTEEMLKKINKARDEIKQDFIKRLERYWKRYSKHVRTTGYWVNR